MVRIKLFLMWKVAWPYEAGEESENADDLWNYRDKPFLVCEFSSVNMVDSTHLEQPETLAIQHAPSRGG